MSLLPFRFYDRILSLGISTISVSGNFKSVFLLGDAGNI